MLFKKKPCEVHYYKGMVEVENKNTLRGSVNPVIVYLGIVCDKAKQSPFHTPYITASGSACVRLSNQNYTAGLDEVIAENCHGSNDPLIYPVGTALQDFGIIDALASIYDTGTVVGLARNAELTGTFIEPMSAFLFQKKAALNLHGLNGWESEIIGEAQNAPVLIDVYDETGRYEKRQFDFAKQAEVLISKMKYNYLAERVRLLRYMQKNKINVCVQAICLNIYYTWTKKHKKYKNSWLEELISVLKPLYTGTPRYPVSGPLCDAVGHSLSMTELDFQTHKALQGIIEDTETQLGRLKAEINSPLTMEYMY